MPINCFYFHLTSVYKYNLHLSHMSSCMYYNYHMLINEYVCLSIHSLSRALLQFSLPRKKCVSQIILTMTFWLVSAFGQSTFVRLILGIIITASFSPVPIACLPYEPTWPDWRVRCPTCGPVLTQLSADCLYI